jgi:protein NrfC
MKDQEKRKAQKRYGRISRRDFLRSTGTVAIGAGLGSFLPRVIWLDDAIAAIPASEGYLLVDTKKCQGCLSCMLACSLVHEGIESLSLARIQVLQNSFEKFPDDLTMAQCRQCTDPACVKACPQGALFADPENGNIRRVEIKRCIGCKACIQACPYEPSRPIWNVEEKHAQVCDLCFNAPFWNQKGGPNGKQACVEVCPLSAIKFTKETPIQKGDGGYKVNLRGTNWKKLGYPTD